MPSLSKSNFSDKSKVTEFKCKQCGITAYAKYINTKFCSVLCRHNAYLKRKAEIGTQSRVQIEKTKNLYIPKLIYFSNSRILKLKLREFNLTVTLKALKALLPGDHFFVGTFKIMRLNQKKWVVKGYF